VAENQEAGLHLQGLSQVGVLELGLGRGTWTASYVALGRSEFAVRPLPAVTSTRFLVSLPVSTSLATTPVKVSGRNCRLTVGSRTLSLDVVSASARGRKAAEGIARRVAWAVSLAFGCPIGVGAAVATSGLGQLASVTWLGQVEEASNWHPLVPVGLTHNGDNELVRFIEHVSPRMRDSFTTKLAHARILAASTSTIDVRAAILVGMLEMIRFKFAESVLVPRKDACRQGDQFKHTGTSKKKGKLWTFRDILTHFAKAQRLTRLKLRKLVSFRNSVVHEFRIPGSSFSQRYSRLLAVQETLDRVLLALLDWDKVHGHFRPVSKVAVLGPAAPSEVFMR